MVLLWFCDNVCHWKWLNVCLRLDDVRLRKKKILNFLFMLSPSLSCPSMFYINVIIPFSNEISASLARRLCAVNELERWSFNWLMWEIFWTLFSLLRLIFLSINLKIHYIFFLIFFTKSTELSFIDYRAKILLKLLYFRCNFFAGLVRL